MLYGFFARFYPKPSSESYNSRVLAASNSTWLHPIGRPQTALKTYRGVVDGKLHDFFQHGQVHAPKGTHDDTLPAARIDRQFSNY